MEIKNVETILLSCPVPKEHQLDWDAGNTLRELKVDMTIIKITTDEGITGIGEASNYVDPKMVRMQIENFKPELIGKDPFEVEKLTESLRLRWTESSFLKFKEWVDKDAMDVIQPDCNLAGFNEARKAAIYASYRGIPCCPHNWHNAITRAANAQLIASVPNHFMLEMNMTWNHSCPAFKEEIVDEPIKVKNGYIDIPNRPGLGIELNEEAVKKYPYIEGPKSAPI